MAKSKHAFAKRQREMEKKLKAEEKRARRHKKKEETSATIDTPEEGESKAGEETEKGIFSITVVLTNPHQYDDRYWQSESGNWL